LKTGMAKKSDIKGSEITPESVYFNRRTFMRAGILAASAIATGAGYKLLNRSPGGGRDDGPIAQPKLANLITSSTQPTTQSDLSKAIPSDETLTSFKDITHYNNFYEFTTSKGEVADVSEGFVARPWSVAVGGLCAKPATFAIDDLLKIAPPEERVYRMRCVEGWSMIIPWAGFPLSKLLDRVEPTGAAKYVAFTTIVDPKRMPGQRSTDVLQWPYVEGLRMDEAMHPLAILASGLYGRELPPQDGAPVRLVVPWKYGFKGIKSIVKIELVDKEPPTTWNRYAPSEYGFYSNVNPNHDHPRWSQATEERIGAGTRIPTLMFNGYAEQVASLYAGMDLDKYF
jgi:methionine sulfoxide reductase catalytic subunit